MEPYKKLTANISPGLLRALKIEAVTNEITYSSLVASRILSFIEDPDKLQQHIKEHRQEGDIINRGRPSAFFLGSKGPIFNKKATFYVPESLCRKIRKISRQFNISVSSIINLSLSNSPSAPPHLRTTTTV